MAWTYLAESVESHLPYHHGSTPSPTVRTTDTLNPLFFPEWRTANFLSHRYGTTSGLSREPGFLRSIWSTEVFPAKTSVLRALAKVWTVTDRDFSLKSSGSSKKQSPHLSSLKTSLRSEQEDLVALCASWPASGSISGGRLSQPQRLEPRTSEKDGSSLLPTPTASEYGSCVGGAAGRSGKVRPSLSSMARADLWPTPTVHGNHNVPKNGTSSGTGLSTAVKLWPTPRASDGAHGGPNQRGSRGGLGLPAAVVQWRTPCARDGMPRGPSDPQKRIEQGHAVSLHDQIGGQLSPLWTEWLMGYPIGWTELSVWATAWFRSKPVQPSKD
jgi:hypothetical protein